MSDALDMAELGAPLDPASLLQVTMTDTEASPETEDDGPLGEIDPCVPEDERNFYTRAYPTFDVVRERKVHCTICKLHIGTAPAVESVIKMHPILRVTHCTKCHDFYNSGEFSKGEDGSELYCRWCGQGGEVYCCSSCPYVFCKSCITKNLSRGVISDIEQNENWNCFNCSTKILWPLRAQHWALVNFIKQQKRAIKAGNYTEAEAKRLMADDRSTCCRLAKAKCGNMSDSLESIDSMHSRRSNGSSHKKTPKPPFPPGLSPSAKRAKPNDELVCTPDLLSMLEPDCQITETPKSGRNGPAAPTNSAPRIMTIQTQTASPSSYATPSSLPRSSAPPPLVLRNTSIKINRTLPTSQPIVRRTIVGPRTPAPTAPVYHTINGYRIDLNSAAQHETFRLPNGKLIQVKRQGVGGGGQAGGSSTSASTQNNSNSSAPWQRNVTTIQSIPSRTTITPSNPNYQRINVSSQQQQQHPQVVRYQNTIMTNRQANLNGPTQVVINGGAPTANVQQQGQSQVQAGTAGATTAPVRPNLLRYIFPDTAIGQARTQLQDQVFNAMEICVHLTNKIQSLTNSNAYKQARNYLEIKELYIHMSYLLTYAIGRFKGLQEKCLGDMRQLGFSNDADCLENGQLAADKQASDDEDNEIEIVEPKTDTITLDSDNDDEDNNPKILNKKYSPMKAKTELHYRSPHRPGPLSHQQRQTALLQMERQPPPLIPVSTPSTPQTDLNNSDDLTDYMSAAQSFLASMLEVEISEGSEQSFSSQKSPERRKSKTKKQPRKKTTNKPNPQLVELERQRLEEMKQNDVKLKMHCAVKLKKVEMEYPNVLEMLNSKQEAAKEENLKRKQEVDTESIEEAETESESKRHKSGIEQESSIEAVPKTNDDDVVELLDDSDEPEKEPIDAAEETEIIDCTPSLPDLLNTSGTCEEENTIVIEEKELEEEGPEESGTKSSETGGKNTNSSEEEAFVEKSSADSVIETRNQGENESTKMEIDTVELDKEDPENISRSETSPENTENNEETNVEKTSEKLETSVTSTEQDGIENKSETDKNEETGPNHKAIADETPQSTQSITTADGTDKKDEGSKVEIEKELEDNTGNDPLSTETHSPDQATKTNEPEDEVVSIDNSDNLETTEVGITDETDKSKDIDTETQKSPEMGSEGSKQPENAMDVDDISLNSTLDDTAMSSSIILLDSTIESDKDGTLDPKKDSPSVIKSLSTSDKSLEKARVNDLEENLSDLSNAADEKSLEEVDGEEQNQTMETAGTESNVQSTKLTTETVQESTAPAVCTSATTTVENTVIKHGPLDADAVVAKTSVISHT